jgi:malate permease and related proteins
LLIYIIAPLVIFHGTVTTTLNLSVLSLPVLFFSLGSVLAVLFLWIGSFIWNDPTKNILAFSAGTGNTGYFGLPVALMLFSDDVLGIMVLSILGFVLFENSVGFYLTARGRHTAGESLMKVLRLPTIYAFALGVIVNLSGMDLGETYASIAASFRGAYTILGMMIIGVGIAGMKGFKPDLAFLGLGFLAKFIVWPLAIFAVIALDRLYLHLYSDDVYKVMILLASVPFAANTVAVASELKAQPEKAAFAVLVSTIFALLYIPVMVVVFIR